jgi:hypothetical protein
MSAWAMMRSLGINPLAKLPHSLTSDRRRAIMLSYIEGGEMPMPTDVLGGRWICSFFKRSLWSRCRAGEQPSVFSECRGMYSKLDKVHSTQRCTDWNTKDGSRQTGGIRKNNRRANFYRLTAAGRKQLETDFETWDRLSAATHLYWAASRRCHLDD